MNHQRDILCKQRKNLTSSARQLVAEKIRQHLLDSPIYHHSQHIGVYMSHHGEVETDLIIQSIWQDNKNCYLPVLHGNKHGHMQFVSYTPHTQLKKNRFGIPEPENQHERLSQTLDCVLMPLVAFDVQGHRLGMGAGYYDRSFQFMLTSPTPPKPILIGLAYRFQQLEQLIPAPWDVPMHGVITEDGLLLF